MHGDFDSNASRGNLTRLAHDTPLSNGHTNRLQSVLTPWLPSPSFPPQINGALS